MMNEGEKTMTNISIEVMDTIESKLVQAYAITNLLMGECDADSQLNDELRSYVLWALSDLIEETKTLFRTEIERGKGK